MPRRRLSVDDYIERIQPDIRHCRYCQPFEDSDVVWIFGKRIGLGTRICSTTTARPADLRDGRVGQGLHREGCSAQLQRWADVGVAYEFEEAHERRIEKARKKYEGALINFGLHLREYPYLGAQHRVGQKDSSGKSALFLRKN